MGKLHVNEKTGETDDMLHTHVFAEHHSPKNLHINFY